MKFFNVLLALVLQMQNTHGLGQVINLVALSKDDTVNGVISKFENDPSGNTIFTRIVLYENGTYKYEFISHLYTENNEGTWKKNGKQLILNSHINKNNLPIERLGLDYGRGWFYPRRRLDCKWRIFWG